MFVDIMEVDAGQYASMSLEMLKSGDYLHLVDRGQDYYLDENDRRSFRLGFAYVPVSRLEDGVRIIAEEVRALL